MQDSIGLSQRSKAISPWESCISQRRRHSCTRCSMLTNDERLNALTGAILGAAIEVHRVLGPGLLESIYLGCLQFELSERGLRFEAQKPVPVVYKSIRLRVNASDRPADRGCRWSWRSKAAGYLVASAPREATRRSCPAVCRLTVPDASCKHQLERKMRKRRHREWRHASAGSYRNERFGQSGRA